MRRQAAYGSSAYSGWSTIYNGNTSSGSTISVNQTQGNGHYQYKVKACSASSSIGCSNDSGWRTVTVAIAPATPGGLSGPASNTTGSYPITWNSISAASTYELERRQAPVGTSAYGNWLIVHNNGSTTYNEDTGISGEYQYRVRACSNIGCSSYASAINVSNIIPVAGGVIDTPPAPLVQLPPTSGITESDQVGATAGQFRVNESGAATYNIPIMAAEGVAGVTPQIGLAYSSSAGKNIAGMGWSLSGLSAISRCRQTLYTDNKVKPITWTSDDRFCLDGQRLVLDSGTYGSAESTYKTEIDSFITVTAKGGNAGDPDYFVVRKKDGSLSTYGDTGNASRDTTNGKTLTWAINEFKDNMDNQIVYTYHDDNHGQQIQKIEYAYGTASTPGAAIEFTYQLRSDITEHYVAGYKFASNRLLSDIKSYNEGALVRHYDLVYQATLAGSPHYNHSYRLASVQECVNNGTCLPATTFEWTQPSAAAYVHNGTTELSDNSTWFTLDFKPADINGDGFTDIVWSETDGSDNYRVSYKLVNPATGRLQPGSVRINTFSDDYTISPYALTINVLDFNGDGRHDVLIYRAFTNQTRVYLSEPVPNTDNEWAIAENFSVVMNEPGYQYADLDSDGFLDAYRITNNQLQVRYLQPSGQATTSSQYYSFAPVQIYNVTMPGNYNHIKGVVGTGVDINADGRGDIILHTQRTVQGTCQTYGTTYPCTVFTGEKDEHFYTWTPTGYVASGDSLPLDTLHRLFVDLNADGLADMVYFDKTSVNSADDKQHKGNWYYQINTGTEFAAAVSFLSISTYMEIKPPTFVDYNQDGYQDFAWNNIPTSKLNIKLWDPVSQTFRSDFIETITAGGGVDALFAMDVNADGLKDIVSYRKTGPMRQLVSYIAPQPRQANLITLITNGLGAETDITYERLSLSDHYGRIKGLSSTTTSNQCFQAYGITANVTYCHDVTTSAVNSGEYYQKLNAPFTNPDSITDTAMAPILELMTPMSVVTRVESSAPVPGDSGAKSGVAYHYEQAKIQAAGRGMLGFKSLTTVDLQTQIKTKTTYRQDWPYVGSPLRTERFAPDGSLLSKAENTWTLKGLDHSAGGTAAKPYQPFIESSIDITYANSSDRNNLDLTVTTQELQRVVTQNWYDSYGNVTDMVTTTTGNGDALIKDIDNTYGSSLWEQEMGRLIEATVTTTRNGVSKARTSAFSYHEQGHPDGLDGMLKTETIQPGGGDSYELQTTYTYDSQGNITNKTIRGHDGNTIADRKVSTEYDTRKRYPVKTRNGDNQVTQEILARNDYGQPTQVTNINEVLSETYYTPMGRQYFSRNSSGAWSQTLSALCTSGCPVDAAYKQTSHAAGGGESISYLDKMGRTVRSETRSFNGQWVLQDTEYDNLSRVKRVSEPYFAGNSPAGWSSSDYDILSRVVQVTAADDTTNRTHYDGYINTLTNHLEQNRIETRNGLGELTRVEDHLGGRIDYTYNAQSKLLTATTSGPSQANGTPTSITVSMTYDALDRKATMSDPDKGNWSYSYNAFGELISQTDGKGQTSTLTYDQLGRQITRIDRRADNSIEGNTTWTYNDAETLAQSTAGSSLGSLLRVQDSESGYQQESIYDSLGRVSETHTTIDGTTHYSKVTYDQYGRVFQHYDAARDGRVYDNNATQTIYNTYGFVEQIVNAGRDNNGDFLQTYYQAIDNDARGNITAEVLGDGYRTTRTYHAQTGRVENTTVNTHALGSGYDLLSYSTDWDALGNLNYKNKIRRDQSGNLLHDLREDYSYDNLNRLESAIVQGGGRMDLSYDSFGNITSKNSYDSLGDIINDASVGNYTYGNGSNGAGPHAVINTSIGNIAYHYDANGNMTSDSSGRTLLYTTFDKPYSISKGTHTTEFSYGPSRSRYKRVDNANGAITTTLYLGGVEKITKPDGSRQNKRYINGVAIVTESYDSSNVLQTIQEQYLYKDHLGSILLITNFDPIAFVTTSVQDMDFDPWGQRRKADNYSHLTSSELANFDHSLTTRGYTGHEMLDEVGLIHMNGRVYDPKLARFIQADPIIDGVTNTQGYNRYSYVANNPLNATDPSGYSGWNKFRDNILKPVVIAVASYFTAGWAAGAYTSAASTAAVAAGTFGQTTFLAITANAAVVGGLVGGAVGGALGAAAYGGSGRDILKGALFGAVSGAAFGAIGGSNIGLGGKALAHGFTGGVMSVLQGGKFGHGFFSAGLTKLANVNSIFGTSAGRVFAAAVIGGTISDATGGKFANGAVTAAFGQLFNGERGRRKPGTGHYSRNAENDKFLTDEELFGRDDLTLDEITDAGDFGMKEASGRETKFHRNGPGNENNLKFTSRVARRENWWQRNISNRYGRYELIVRPNENGTFTHVNSPLNMGTLNRGNNPFTHFTRDIIPYWQYGNVRK